jgi:tetratricopeptide (TPR) repeat protein
VAEAWSVAFGRYLRTLRERRSLSLIDVCQLSQAFTETVSKGYLSRCENGRQGPSFSKVIPLGRIYRVRADALLERLELDMELERAGAPDTAGRSFEQLTDDGNAAIRKGFGWEAYAYLRDATARAATDTVRPVYESRAEQIACAHMNCATAARRLGRRQFALHEYTYLEEQGALGPRLLPILFERLSQSFRTLDRMEPALAYAEKAMAAARAYGDPNWIGNAYSNRAQLAVAVSDLEQAVDLFRKAYEYYHEDEHLLECARSLINLAQVYFDLGRLRAARRSLLAAEKLAGPLGQQRALALGRILMGEIDSREHRDDVAHRLWKEAAAIAKRLNDRTLRFKAEFLLYKQACAQGDEPVARSIHRRLEKLSHWIPRDTPELAEFRDLPDDPPQRTLN